MRFLRNFWALRLALPALVLLGTPGCATWDKETAAVPKNYRQLIAQRLATESRSRKVIKAEISRPGEWAGIGVSRPIACVALTVDGPLGEQRRFIGFMFENGLISQEFFPDAYDPMAGYVGTVLKSAVTCGKLEYSPFTELKV